MSLHDELVNLVKKKAEAGAVRKAATTKGKAKPKKKSKSEGDESGITDDGEDD